MTTLLQLLRTQALPILAVMLVIAAIGWRVGHSRDARVSPRPTPRTTTHAIGGAVVDAPATWRSLDRTLEHATWGDVDHSHTVTLGSMAQGEGSLAGVVHAIARDASTVAPGAAVVGAPQLLDLSHGGRGDAAMLLRLEVPTRGSRPLQVAQVWRRDARAQLDVVATWTSSDGRWPVDPARSLPGSRVR